VLDALFPLGRRSRQLVRLAFWLLNPLSGLLLLPVRFNTWLVSLVGALLGWLLRVLNRLLRRRPPAAASDKQLAVPVVAAEATAAAAAAAAQRRR
jgi:hypothetical protein